MENLILKVLDEQIDGFITADQTAFRGCDIHEWFKAVNRLIDKGILRKRDCAGLAYEYDYYGCDGENENCKHNVLWKDVNWFTSSIGFCDCCWDKLHTNLIEDELEELYESCNSGDDNAAEKVCSNTR